MPAPPNESQPESISAQSSRQLDAIGFRLMRQFVYERILRRMGRA